jgi:hypothetical protein
VLQGNYNTVVSNGLSNNTSGAANTAVGLSVLQNNVVGNNNSGVGLNSLQNTTGSNNTGIGCNSGTANTTGSNNTYLGYNTTTGAGYSNSTAIGYNAAITGSNQIVLGAAETVYINGPIKMKINNDASVISIGQALNTTFSGVYNVFIGNGCGQNLTSGSYNTAISTGLSSITTGSSNSSFGLGGLSGLTTGSNNVSIGVNSGSRLTTQNYNTFLGNGADLSGNFSGSTAVGVSSLITGNSQVVLGTTSTAVICPNTLQINNVQVQTLIHLTTGIVIGQYKGTYPFDTNNYNLIYDCYLVDISTANSTIYLPTLNNGFYRDGIQFSIRAVGTGYTLSVTYSNNGGPMGGIYLKTSPIPQITISLTSTSASIRLVSYNNSFYEI